MIKWLREKVKLKFVEECPIVLLAQYTKVFVNGFWAGMVEDPVQCTYYMKYYSRESYINLISSSLCSGSSHCDFHCCFASSDSDSSVSHVLNKTFGLLCKPGHWRRTYKNIVRYKIKWEILLAPSESKMISAGSRGLQYLALVV
jgi:hypothetical protein